MTVIINLPPALEDALRKYTATTGEDVSDFVLQAVHEKIAKARTLAEVCEPFSRAVAASGISDSEFDQFFEDARNEAWREQRKRP